MLEATLSSGGGANKNFPDSGPGSKNLIFGSDDLGYFGDVSTSQFLTISELRRQLEFYAGVDNGTNAQNWVKTFYKKKVLFFPQYPLASNLSWNAMYAAGLVYGVDGPGEYPASTGPVNQLKYVTIGNDLFKVRLFNAWGLSTRPPGNTEYTLAGAAEHIERSEWGSLVQSLVKGTPATYTGPKWAVYSADSFLGPRFGQMMNTTTGTDQMIFASNTQLSYGGKSATVNWWLPVLELVPNDQRPLLPVNGLIAAVVGQEPGVVEEIVQDVGLTKYRARYATIGLPVAPVVDELSYFGVLAVRRSDIQVTTTTQRQPFVDDITYS